jgi:hypothetical protein
MKLLNKIRYKGKFIARDLVMYDIVYANLS